MVWYRQNNASMYLKHTDNGHGWRMRAFENYEYVQIEICKINLL